MRARVFTEEHRKWWTLGAVAFSLFMVMLDNTVVNVALPAIQQDFGIGLSELEWVVTGYILSFAVLMLTGGKLADMYGRRRLFLIGLAVFTASSLWCGLATSAEMLIAGRVVQGVGAAAMMPATLSIISATFPPKERGAALGAWAGVSALALALGPLVGGLLTEHVGWEWVFFINVPVGVAGIVAGTLIIRESKDTSREQRLDLPGLIASAIALFTLVFALIEANTYGWRSPEILTLFVVSFVAAVAFVVLEHYQRIPMFDLSLFRDSTFTGANIVAVLISFAMFGVIFFMSLFMQNVLGYSAIRTGVAFLPMTACVILVAPLAGRTSDRIGSRWLMVGGMTLTGISLLVFAQAGADAGYGIILLGMALGGIGMPMNMSPMMAAALSGVPVDKAGVGAGMINSSRQVGGVLGVAVLGAIVAAETTGSTPSDVFVNGLRDALYVSAAIAFVGALTSLLLIRSHARSRAKEGRDLAEAARPVTLPR